MTFQKGVQKLYNPQKIPTACDPYLVTDRLTKPRSSRFWSNSGLGVNENFMHNIAVVSKFVIWGVSFINPVRLFAGFYCWGQEYEVIPTR
jgi:hypothetical protein